MWVIKDDDSTIYLFGTFHILRPETQWKVEKITKAVADSTELWLEIADIDSSDPTGTIELLSKYGSSPDKPLSTRLTPAQKERLSSAAALYTFPTELLEKMKPWSAAVTLIQLPIFKAGYNPNYGVEPILTVQARLEGDKVLGLETTEEQLQLLDSLSEADQLAFLDEAISEAEEGVERLDQLIKAWNDGDLAALEKDVVDEMKNEAPSVYRRLIVDRNVRWSEEIREMLEGAGVQVIAVGAGHLIGPDSVQAQLLKSGIKAERY